MYAVCKQTDPPTSIEHAIYCRFINLDSWQLVTVGGNQLRVFRVNPAVTSLSLSGSYDTSAKLECLLQFSFFGQAESIARVFIAGSKRDTLILCFQEAKLSLVQYDPENHCLKTVSLHVFEDDMLKCGLTWNLPRPILAADHDFRCAGMLVYGRYLAVLPLLRDTMFEEDAQPVATQGHLSLQSYTVNLFNVEEKLQNVKDMCFLHGYYEPTLLLLYEPSQTTTGRVAVRYDTYHILAISLNIKERVHAVIWQIGNLPFDCLRVYPIPKPIGGVMVFAANSVIYLNQSVPPYGIALNSNYGETTNFPMKSQEDKGMTLDGANADFLNTKSMVLSLRSGDLYVLTILADNMNSVKLMHFDRAASSIITSDVCRCDAGFVFLASRLGNSLLLRYWENGQIIVNIEENEPSALPVVIGTGAPPILTDLPEPNSGVSTDPRADGGPAPKRPRNVQRATEDDTDIYGDTAVVQSDSQMNVAQYAMEVCDSWMNIGPIRAQTVGEPPFVPAQYQKRTSEPIVDMVFAAGHAKNGCLAVVQRSVRPNMITNSPISSSRQLWTVGGFEAEFQDYNPDDPTRQPLLGSQRYLLISREVDTMILEMREEIFELDTSGFEMNQRTIAVEQLGDGAFMIQVTPMQIILLDALGKRIHEVSLDTSFPVCQASICDPFVVLLTDNGEVILITLEIDQESESPELIINRPPIQQNIPATAVCVYKDVSGLFMLTKRNRENEFGEDSKAFFEGHQPRPPGTIADEKSYAKGGPSQATQSAGATGPPQDEDKLLYGENAKNAKNTRPSTNFAMKTESDLLFRPVTAQTTVTGTRPVEETDRSGQWLLEQPTPARDENRTSHVPFPSYWVAIGRENGMLEIFSMPEFKLAYMAKKFSLGARTVRDSDPFRAALDLEQKTDEKNPPVKELLMIGLGANRARPFLFAVVEDELLLYEAFTYSDGFSNHLSIRFRKIEHNVWLRNAKLVRSEGRASAKRLEQNSTSVLTGPIFKYFENVGGYTGVFINGPYPYLVVVSSTGLLRCHPMHIDGTIISFTPFHNANCQHGFIYLTDQSNMTICQLNPNMNYDCSVPTHKVPLKATVHHVVYLLDSKSYAVAYGAPKVGKTMVEVTAENEKRFVEREEHVGFVMPSREDHIVQLFASETFEQIPGAREDMQDFERVTCMKEIQLTSEGTVSGFQNYLAFGTIINYGEELLTRGRIFICEIIEVVPEPGMPITKHKFKKVYCKEQKGPVTSLCSVMGNLLTGMGQKVYIWSFKDGDLVGISFLDMQFYIHRMIAIRSIVLVADVFKSVSLLRYQPGCKALSVASRDLRNLEVLDVEFMVDNKQLAFLVSDQQGNIYIYTYQPDVKESNGGQRLLRRSDLHFGARIHSFYRIRSHFSDPVVEYKTQAVNRHVVFFATLDGGMGFVLPLPEKTYRRLFMLQTELINFLPHSAGLNPKSFRSVRNSRPMLQNPQKNLLDGELCWKFMYLSSNEKTEIALKFGTVKEQIMDDLLEITRMSTHF